MGVAFKKVVAKDGQTAAQRYAALTHEPGTFYQVGDELYLNDVCLTTDYASEVEVTDSGSVFTATNVEDVLAELYAEQLDKTLWFHDDSAGQSTYAKVYNLYQGTNDFVADRTDGKTNPRLVGTINTPKDLVVRAGSVVTITFDSTENKLYDGLVDVTELIVGSNTPTEADAGKYIKLEIQNQDDPIYIAVKDLVDIYTGGDTAEVEVDIDANNEITATIAKIAATKIVYSAAVLYTQQEYDDYVTEHGTAPSWAVGDVKVPEVNVKDKIDDVVDYIGTIPAGAQSTNVVDYIDEKTGDGVGSLNGEAGIATKSAADVVTLKGGVIEVEGVIQNAPTADLATTEDVYYDAAENKIYSDAGKTTEVTPVTTKTYIDQTSGKHLNWTGKIFIEVRPDVMLEKVAVTGAAEDVSIDDVGGVIAATNVEDALQELATTLTWVEV